MCIFSVDSIATEFVLSVEFTEDCIRMPPALVPKMSEPDSERLCISTIMKASSFSGPFSLHHKDYKDYI